MDNRTQLPILGIQRNLPQGNNGCDELINLRPSNGAWRPVAPKVELYDDPAYDKEWIHKQDNIENWIGYTTSTRVVVHYNPDTLDITQAVVTLDSEEALNKIRFLKRFMLVITTKNIYKYVYKENANTSVVEYISVDLTGIESWFDIELETDYIQEVTSSEFSEETGSVLVGAAGLYGKYLEMVNNLSDDSRLIGGIYTRYALRLFDGSYILHSAPKFHQMGDYTAYLKRSGAAQFRWIFNKDGDQATIQLTGGAGTAVITTLTEDGQETKIVTSAGSSEAQLTTAASDFVSANVVGYYANWHIILSSSGSKLIFATSSNSPQDTPTIETSSGTLSGDIECESGANKLKATAIFDDSTTTTKFAELKDVVESIVLFSSQNQQFWDVNEEDIADFATIVPAEEDIENVDSFLIIDEHFKEDMHDSVSWYKIGEVQFRNLEFDASTRYEKEMDVDLEGFFQNYATRETLPLDNFSHHDLTGNASKVYNDRLMLTDTLQSLASPYINDLDRNTAQPIIDGTTYTYASQMDVIIQVVLNTTDGKKVVWQIATEMDMYYDPHSVNDKVVLFPNSISYPDSRATEIIIIYASAPGSYFLLERSNLTKSKYSNFSYLINESFSKDDTDADTTDPRNMDTNFNSYYIKFDTDAGTPFSLLDISDEVVDNNRVQVSEVNNPFVFPVENSQQVGNGIGRAFGVQTEVIGVSQFGQFPIIVFTSTGRWAMEIGTGDIYILSVRPLDGEVVRDNSSTLDLSFGIAYITKEGLMISSGKDRPIQISEPVEGLQDRYFSDNLNFQYFIAHSSLVQMTDYVDKIPFLLYLEGAVLGYNKGLDTNELIVSNPDYEYAYVYDFNSKAWYKLSGNYERFIPNYPDLYAVEDGKVLNMSSEGTGSTQVMIVTRAQSFGAPEVFKKLRRSFLRAFFTTSASKYAAAYLFKSDDLQTWSYVTGNDVNTGTFKDIWITHSLSSARYFIYVFIADLSVDKETILNRISHIDCEIALKREHKLR